MNQEYKESKERVSIFDLVDRPKGLVCPDCGCSHFRTRQTRRQSCNRIKREKECRHCGNAISTYERIVDE